MFTVPDLFPRVRGPTRAVLELAAHAARKGHDVHVLTQSVAPRGDGEAAADPRVQVVLFPARRERSLRPPRGLQRRLETLRPDVVVCNEVRNGLTGSTLRWALRRGVRAALQPHGGLTAFRHLPRAWQRWPYHAYDWVGSRTLRDARLLVLASCRAEEEELRSLRFPAERLARLYLGVRPGATERNLRRREWPRVLTVANFGVFRDPRWVVRACQLLQERGRPTSLLLAGPLQNQSRLSRGLRASDFAGARHVGFVPQDKLPELYAEADVFCYPTRYENFGLPVLEAACAGLPVVTTPFGIANELALTPPAGSLVARPSPEAVAQGLAEILENLDASRRTARERSTRLRRWADWARRAEPFLEWLEGGRWPPVDSPESSLRAPPAGRRKK